MVGNTLEGNCRGPAAADKDLTVRQFGAIAFYKYFDSLIALGIVGNFDRRVQTGVDQRRALYVESRQGKVTVRLADRDHSRGGALAARRTIGKQINPLVFVLARQLRQHGVVIDRRFAQVVGRQLANDRCGFAG